MKEFYGTSSIDACQQFFFTYFESLVSLYHKMFIAFMTGYKEFNSSSKFLQIFKTFIPKWYAKYLKQMLLL